MMIYMLLLVFCGVGGRIAFRRWRRHTPKTPLPPGYRLLAIDIKGASRIGVPGPVVLRDDEYGITARPAALLQGPTGEVVPLEVLPAGSNYRPGTIRPSHVAQMMIAMLACDADSRIGVRPTEGWLWYSRRGRVVPGGAVQIPNTPEALEYALRMVTEMRRVLFTQEVVHGNPDARPKCRECSTRTMCLEAYAAEGAPQEEAE
jgi:hypothetical protein